MVVTVIASVVVSIAVVAAITVDVAGVVIVMIITIIAVAVASTMIVVCSNPCSFCRYWLIALQPIGLLWNAKIFL